MKHPLYLVIVGLLAGVAILAVIAFQSLDSPQQTALSKYLRYYNAMHPGIAVSQIVQATQPAHFTTDMSGPVFGDSTHFHTDLHLLNPTGNAQTASDVPYPPEQLACVLMGTGNTNAVVFIALHHDGATSEWLVHEAHQPWQSDGLKKQLAAVGCQFSPADSQ